MWIDNFMRELTRAVSNTVTRLSAHTHNCVTRNVLSISIYDVDIAVWILPRSFRIRHVDALHYKKLSDVSNRINLAYLERHRSGWTLREHF
jgi:hypothetical protein